MLCYVQKISSDCFNFFNVKSNKNANLPFIQIIPKFHKKPVDFRVIIASKNAVSENLSKMVSNALVLITKRVKSYCEAIYRNTGVNCCWMIENNAVILNSLNEISVTNSAKNINTFDFGQMYTNLLHKDISEQLRKVIKLGFGKSQNMWVNAHNARWIEPSNFKQFNRIDYNQLLSMVNFVVDNTYFQFGNQVYRQQIGVPMGTSCAPRIADLTLFSYEFTFMTNHMKKNNLNLCFKLKFCFRYIDDVSIANDDGKFEAVHHDIYPDSLTLKKVNSQDYSADILDISASIINGKFVCKLYDKRADFPFKCNVFPAINSNIAASCKYNTFYSRLFRFFNIVSDPIVLSRTIKNLISILISKNYNKSILLSKFKKFINKNSQKYALKFSLYQIKLIKTEVIGSSELPRNQSNLC